jgi:MFS transporter, UMF1 family
MDKPEQRAPATYLGLVSWAMYDWANSAHAAVITTFVFSAYFVKGVAADPVRGTEIWGYAISISGILIAVLSPMLGAIADQAGRRKPWIFVFTVVLALATASLWFVKPDPVYALPALVLVAVATVAFELATVFYNAMLPGLAGRDHIGRVSGWAWGFGYFGGLACLGLTFIGFVNADVPWFGLDKGAAEHVRITGPIVATWLTVFALPLFLFTPDTARTGANWGAAVKSGLKTLADTVRAHRRYRSIILFLVARMFYTEGLNTLFAFGGIYAAGTFGMDFSELILFGVGMNVTAGIGAALFAWLDDWFGPKRTIIGAVVMLTVLGATLLVIDSKTMFWVFGLPLGLFVGPAQSASRSLMAHMAPPALRNEMFGLFALSGKITAFMGPALLAWTTAAAGNQRAGMATILAFFVVGLLLLRNVPDVRR